MSIDQVIGGNMNKNSPWYAISLSNKLIFFIIVILIGSIFASSLTSYFLAKEELDEKGKTILENSVRLAELYAESKYHLVSSGEMEREARAITPRGIEGVRPDDCRQTTPGDRTSDAVAKHPWLQRRSCARPSHSADADRRASWLGRDCRPEN